MMDSSVRGYWQKSAMEQVGNVKGLWQKTMMALLEKRVSIVLGLVDPFTMMP